jgi:hypothetical protein
MASRLVLCFASKFNLPVLSVLNDLYSICIILYMDRNPHSLTELPLAHSSAILSAQVWTADCKFLVAADKPLFFAQVPVR